MRPAKTQTSLDIMRVFILQCNGMMPASQWSRTVNTIKKFRFSIIKNEQYIQLKTFRFHIIKKLFLKHGIKYLESLKYKHIKTK